MGTDDFTNTFAAELKALATDPNFDQMCSAAALFFWSDNHVLGTRIEATQIMAEFSDNVEFGRDPEGFLFYSAPGDLAKATAKDAYYKIHLNEEKPVAIRIDFFWNDPDAEKYKKLPPIAKFLTRDTSSITKDTMSHLDKHKGQGKWKKLNMGVCSAVVDKDKADYKVVLTIESIKKEIKFEVGQSLVDVRIDSSPGVLHFQNIDDLADKKTSTVSFDSDRILYYDKSDKKKMIGVFLPSSNPFEKKFNNHGDQNPPEATSYNT